MIIAITSNYKYSLLIFISVLYSMMEITLYIYIFLNITFITDFMQNLCAVAGKIVLRCLMISTPIFPHQIWFYTWISCTAIFLFLQIPARLAHFRLIYVQSLIDPDSTYLCRADLI